MNARTRLKLFISLVLLFSAALIIVALSLQIKKNTALPDPAYDIVINCLYSIATSLIGSVVVVYASSKILGEPLDTFISETKRYIHQLSQLNQSASTTGLLQVFPRRADAQETFFNLLGTKWTNLDVMAVKIEFLSYDPRFEEYLMAAYERGANIRILLINIEDKKKLDDRANYESRSDFSSKAQLAVSSFKTIAEKCSKLKGYNSTLEIRGHEEYLPISMVRVDDEMLYYTRTRNQRGAESPLYRVQKVPHGIFELYLRDFELLWNKYAPTNLNGDR